MSKTDLNLFKPTALDNLIGKFSPRARTNRIQARATATWMENYGPLMPAYNGASNVRQAMQKWNPMSGSADRDVLPSLPTLRARSRDAVRNIPIAAGAIGRKKTNVVGTGLRMRPTLDAEQLGITPEQARTIEKRLKFGFSLWGGSKDCDASRTSTFYQMQLLAYGSQLENGDCFALTPMIKRKGSFFNIRVALLEGDRCRNPDSNLPTERLAGGIEVDKHGAPLAYWFTKKPVNGIGFDGLLNDFQRVPAFGRITGRPLVLHLFKPTRIGQRRGVPMLAGVLEPLKQLGRYQDAEIMAAVVSGMFSVFITTPDGAPTLGNLPPALQTGPTAGQVAGDPGVVEMSYGGVANLAKGETIETANPGRPNTNYDPFVNSIFKEIGSALNMPYEVMVGAFSSSYSAARAAILEAWKQFKIDRADLAVDFCQPVYEAWMMEAVSRGFVDLPGYMEDPLMQKAWASCKWVGPAPGSIDPEKEGKAYKLFVDEEFMSRSDATLELTGADHESNLDGLEEEQEQRRARDLPEPPGPAGTAKTESETEEFSEKDD